MRPSVHPVPAKLCVGPGVAGHVLAEQRIGGVKCRLDDALAPHRQLHLIRTIGTGGCG